MRVDTQTILSIHHELITQNTRLSLSYNDHRSWFLHIKQAEESDRGWYMCQVNTDPMRSSKGYLQVVGESAIPLNQGSSKLGSPGISQVTQLIRPISTVPPSIVEQETSVDLVVREGSSVTLQCKAKGYPQPFVMWRREDGSEMLIGGEYGESPLSLHVP